MTLNKESTIAYFLEKGPKALREKEISVIRELEHVHGTGGGNVFIINDNYAVYLMQPEPMNCLMRIQNYSVRISGRRISKRELERFLNGQYYKQLNN